MKKILSISLALLLIVGGAYAASIPGAVDPKAGPENWKTAVFNNQSATNFDAGDVVVWDIDNSTGDNDNYVTTTTTANTTIVAGVVWPGAINAGNDGSVVLFGAAECDVTGIVDAMGPLCTSTTAGEAVPCADDQNAFGFATVAKTSLTAGQIACFIQK